MNDKEKKTISLMIHLYCRKNHQSDKQLCSECLQLEEYAHNRLEKCPFKEEKPACKNCPIHCYGKVQREKIKAVMRFSGPRMFLYHPVETIRHYFSVHALRNLSLLILFLLPFLIFSCQTTGNIKKDFHSLETNLYYELSTPVYQAEIKDTVFLNPIISSEMSGNVSVKRKQYLILPLILYNHVYEKFKVTLGENILKDYFSDFLTEALLAECNRSTCFYLKNDLDNLEDEPDYFLEIKILKNETTSMLKYKDNLLFIPIFEDSEGITWNSYTYDNPKTKIKIQVSLLKGSEQLFEKVFSTDFETPKYQRSFDDTSILKEACAENMAECLSLATKQIVEDISAYLHYYMLSIK